MTKNSISKNIARFLSNVSKLDKKVHLRVVDKSFGTVKLIKTASENNGKRLYSVSSKYINSGSYTAAGLRRAFSAR